MINTVKLIYFMILYNIKARSMYTVNFIIALMQSVIMTAVSVGLTWIILDRFKDINGWNFFEVGFMYAFSKLVISLVMAVFSVVFGMDILINLGEIDRLLLRPKSPFVIFVFQRFDITFFGDIIVGIIIILYCAAKVGVVWNIPNISLFVIVLISACMIYFSLLFITGTMAFWFLRSSSLRDFMIEVFNVFSPYPISIYSKSIQIVLSTVLPFAFIYYYPALHFLNKSSQVFPKWFSYLTPLAGLIFITISFLTWHLGLKSYKSSGT